MENVHGVPLSTSDAAIYAPEVSRDSEGPQVYNESPLIHNEAPLVYNQTAPEKAYVRTVAPEQRSRLFGLSTRAFWLVEALVAAIVIASAVGAGVGGSRAAKKPG